MTAWKLDDTIWNGTADGTTRRRASSTVMGATGRAGPALAALARLALGETLWSTRCIICDTPGEVLCRRCRMRLPYIDRCRSCPRCGAPNGIWACTDCNTFTLKEAGRKRLPFERCVSVIEHRGAARSIVTGYKDGGERRLADSIASLMRLSLPRPWLEGRPAITYVPADRKARRRRGFDHMELVAEALSERTGLPCRRLLEKEPGADQRGLSRRERIENMSQRIRASPATGRQDGLIVIDDVFTTGATLFAACDALRDSGARHIRCATFARTT